MNHLDALEAESVYILREAFAKLEKLAILWSLGKDSNVVLWLVRKAFFGHVPFPVMHVDTERKFPEMYAFRDRYAEEWKLNFIRELCPPIGGDRPDPAAGRPLGRAQDAGPEGRGRQARLQRPDPGHPPRRGGDPRQGALFQPARRGQQLEPQGPAAGVLEPVHDQLPGRHACPRPSAAALDRGRHLEVHQAREHPGDRSLFRQERQALPLAGRPGHHQPDPERGRHARRDHRASWRRPGCPSARAGPWTTSPRTRSSGCAPPATCEAGPDHAPDQEREPPAAHRDRRPRRSRQVDPGRPADPRDRLAARRQARRDQGHVRAARHAVRVGLPDGRDPGGARPGHHDRHDADLVPHRRSGPTSSSMRRATRNSSRTW